MKSELETISLRIGAQHQRQRLAQTSRRTLRAIKEEPPLFGVLNLIDSRNAVAAVPTIGASGSKVKPIG